MNTLNTPGNKGLYDPAFEKDNCGFGLIAQMDGLESHWVVETAIEALGRMTHRGAIAADGKSGDGCGLLLRKPERFLRQVAEDSNIKATPTLKIRHSNRPSLSFTSVSRPIHCRSGILPNPFAIWHTMVRSTPFRATVTGRMHVPAN